MLVHSEVECCSCFQALRKKEFKAEVADDVLVRTVTECIVLLRSQYDTIHTSSYTSPGIVDKSNPVQSNPIFIVETQLTEPSCFHMLCRWLNDLRAGI